MPSEPTITNNEAKKRFEARVNQHTAVLEYILTKQEIVYTHTEVPKNLEGQGIASHLAKTALEYARDHDLKVMPLCPYMATYMRRHPEYRSLLRPGFNL